MLVLVNITSVSDFIKGFKLGIHTLLFDSKIGIKYIILYCDGVFKKLVALLIKN